MPERVALAPGMRIQCRDAEWLITKTDFSDRQHLHHAVHCVGADDLVRGHEAVFLTQLEVITPVNPRETKLVPDTTSGFRLARLFLEAQLRQMPATTLVPDLDNMGVFEPMNFQVQTVAHALQQLRPRILLADDVGLGKTIQVGMILSELMRRGRANRVLVLAKKSMLTQFQAELWNRFNLPLVRLDSEGIARLRLHIPANKNPFEVYHRVIISMDTLKNVGSYRHFLENTHWDCVVIDEAHNVAGASVPERHLSHRLARLLSRRTDSMLLTTATPHNGKRETFARLISLLDPSAIPDPDLKEYGAEDIRDFFFMRFKEDVREDAGANLTDRLLVPASETTADATPEEEKVYAALAELRRAATAREGGDEAWKHQGLIQYGIYKQFLSSPESCLKTVRKRMATVKSKTPGSPELDHLERIARDLDGLDIRKSSRYQLLLKQLRIMGWKGGKNCPRVLVFTEFRETQDALVAALAKDFGLPFSDKFEAQPAQVIAAVHGSCPDIHLMKTIEAFGTESAPVRMLVATDVASEGINLHHACHNIIHYDLPWSIITLIQRNGRIDRFGQTENPVLRYLRVRTEQGLLAGDDAIFDRLIAKVEEINRSTRQGGTVLKLYDEEAEERYIAESGLLAGNTNVLDKAATGADPEAAALEQMLREAQADPNDNYVASLLGQTEPGINTQEPPIEDANNTRLRLYTDKNFLREGYRHLRDLNPDYPKIEEDGPLLMLTAPKDLRRSLGAPGDRGDVIFGSTAIPAEAWSDDHVFRLSDDPKRVAEAISAARKLSGHWSRELLCTDQHPVLKWVGERLLMLLKRGECPHVTSHQLPAGEICFCFIGQVTSRSGTPLIVDPHAVSFSKGAASITCRPLTEALEAAGFDRLVNDDTPRNTLAAGPLLGAAVDQSLLHLHKRYTHRSGALVKLARVEGRRLRAWQKRRNEILEARIERLGDTHPRARGYRKEMEETDRFVADRQKNWTDTFTTASEHPTTQLVLVIEGVR